MLLFLLVGFVGKNALASQSVQLNWTDSPDPDIVSYNIYFGTQSGVYSSSVTVADVSDVTIPGLQEGQTYYFAATAVDSNRNESALSNEAVYTVPYPTNLLVQVQPSSADFGAVAVSWTPSPTPGTFGYVVYFGTMDGSSSGSDTYFYTTNGLVTGLTPGARYYFAVAPIDQQGYEAVSSQQVTYTVPPKPQLTLSIANTTSQSGVSLQWTDLSGQGANAYAVLYGTQPGVYTQAASYGLVTNAVITNLKGGQIYYFAVQASDVFGDQTSLSSPVWAVAPLQAPIPLQTKTLADGTGHSYGMYISTGATVYGYWEVQSSSDMQNWNSYTSGYGYGNGNGYDVQAYVPFDSTVSQLFFRVVQ